MSSRHKKFRPYIRRRHASDRSDDFHTALRLSIFDEAGWGGWVLVQHGVRGKVIAVERSRDEVVGSVVSSGESFREWALRVQGFGEMKF
ncbi:MULTISPECIES: hypothetical protein [unclassified Thioalkalivibrio]|uniref:hypothetical protein n=1 Tax=unclassified Thioalkalivibrio TaxID=2621013 RepID=UPI000380499C|nr:MULTISPECIES: hypothetical protein [unclassified Thioalkalivibrio]